MVPEYAALQFASQSALPHIDDLTLFDLRVGLLFARPESTDGECFTALGRHLPIETRHGAYMGAFAYQFPEVSSRSGMGTFLLRYGSHPALPRVMELIGTLRSPAGDRALN